MDIAFYLSELLGELGRVTIPGLGTFTRKEIAGYYNEQEAKFYPPGSEIIFDPHFTDDDTFAAYVGQQKKISLASSKYFIDKYISKMKTEAENRDIPFGELGSLHYEEAGGLSFTKARKLTDDPAHFGYPQIELQKISKAAFLDQLETYEEPPIEQTPVVEVQDEPIVQPEAVDTTPVEAEQPHHEDNVKKPSNFSSEMEDYLRELEGGAYIAGPEITAPEPVAEPVTETEPVAEEHKPEEIAPEVPITADLPGYTPEPVTPPATIEPAPEIEPYILPVVPVTPVNDETHHEEEFVFDGKGYDDVDTKPAEKRSLTWLWILLGIVVIAAGVGGFIYYKHQQALKKYQSTTIKQKPVLKPDSSKKVIVDTLNDDSAATDSAKKAAIKDTTQKAPAATVVAPVAAASAIDSTKIRYEIMGTKCRTMAEANIRVMNLKSLGITGAHIITGPVPGRLIEVSLGTFSSRAEAMNKKRELLNTGNVQKDIYVLPFNPNK